MPNYHLLEWEMGNGLKPISIDILNAEIPFIGMG
jgi:hypothetical protein